MSSFIPSLSCKEDPYNNSPSSLSQDLTTAFAACTTAQFPIACCQYGSRSVRSAFLSSLKLASEEALLAGAVMGPQISVQQAMERSLMTDGPRRGHYPSWLAMLFSSYTVGTLSAPFIACGRMNQPAPTLRNPLNQIRAIAFDRTVFLLAMSACQCRIQKNEADGSESETLRYATSFAYGGAGSMLGHVGEQSLLSEGRNISVLGLRQMLRRSPHVFLTGGSFSVAYFKMMQALNRDPKNGAQIGC